MSEDFLKGTRNAVPENSDTSEKQLEEARAFGKQYSSVIDVALGRTDAASLVSEQLDPKLRLLLQQVHTFKNAQIELQKKMQLDARGILSQVFKTDEHQKLFEDDSKFRLEELSPGVYGIFVDPKLSSKLRPGAAALAVSLKSGVSFLMLQDHTDPEFRQKYLLDNLPHETHHLIWGAAQRQETFPSAETDLDYRRSFVLFQDELLARASTDGGLAGYAHIHSLSSDA